jgi:hypothetical protein
VRNETRVALAAMAQPRPKQKPWEWLAECVDYGRVPNYDTENKSQYDPDFFPGWKELLEMSYSREVREMWVLKCSRAGGTENLLLGGLRYGVAREPCSTLFMTGSQTAAEGMMRRRIKRGFALASETAKKFARAHVLEHEIFFEEMDFRVGWVADKMIYKQDGYERIYGDEVSLWPLQAAELLRKRTAGYAFSTLVAISSIDPKASRPTSADPIWIEYKAGNQLNWYMPDPKTRRLFKFEKGDRGLDTPGIKWDPEAKREDGTWDLDKVRATAYYQTPDGTKILNKNRMKVARRGKWVAENPDAPAGIVSAKWVSPQSPLKAGDFGELAVNFLKAKMKKNPQYMRTYLYEEWCEEHTDNMLRVTDSLVTDRVERNHTKGKPLFSAGGYMAKFYERKQTAVFTGIDVQQAHMVCYAEEYVDGGDHATLDWRHVVTWEEAEQFANQVRAAQIWADYGYAKRQLEVLRACHQLGEGWIPAKGADKISMPYKQTFLDPFEGTTRQKDETSVLTFSWHTDIFKMMKLDLLKGESDRKWHIYNHPEAMLANQLASEERIEGVWVVKSGHENHLWDCSVLCLLAAVVSGIYHTGYQVPAMK